MTRNLAASLFLTLLGCTSTGVMGEEPGDISDDGLPTQGAGTDAPVDLPPTPLAADMCDESTYTGSTWQTFTTAHFTLSYLPGTPAETDRDAIAERLEEAYATIRSSLGITSEPKFTVNLSPNRQAAIAHNRGTGRAWGYLNRYDAIYTGVANSFENVRYGYLLTSVLDFHVDASNRYRIPVLATGVNEYFDQSYRGMHDAYAAQLVAGKESRAYLAELDTKDVNGSNYGRSGSLVQFLVDRYGMTKFRDIYRATAVNWDGTCYMHNTYGCQSTPDQVTNMLDAVIFAQTGEHWSQIQPMWQAEVDAALDRAPLWMVDDAAQHILNVVRTMDLAIKTDDAALYRTTVEGFYCDNGGEPLRAQRATRAVNAYGELRTQVLALYPTGIKNFPTAQALVMRTDDHGIPSFATLTFEHLPAGWRVISAPEW